MRRSLLGNALMPEVAVVFELALVQVLENALLFFGCLLYAFVKLVLCGVLYFLALALDSLALAHFRTVHFLSNARVEGVGLLGARAYGAQD